MGVLISPPPLPISNITMLPNVGYRRRNPLSRRSPHLPLTIKDLLVAADYAVRQYAKRQGRKKAVAGAIAAAGAAGGVINYARKRFMSPPPEERPSKSQRNITNIQNSVDTKKSSRMVRKYKNKVTFKKKRRKRGRSKSAPKYRSNMRKLVDRRIKRIIQHPVSQPYHYMKIDAGNLSSTVNVPSVSQFNIRTEGWTDEVLNNTSPTLSGSTITWKDLQGSVSNKKILWYNTSFKFEFCNNYNYGCKLNWYMVIEKDHSGSSPLGLIQAAMDTEYFLDVAGVGPPTAELNFQTKQFNESEFKKAILKTKYIKLISSGSRVFKPGETHNLFIKCPKGILDMKEFNARGQPDYIRNCTVSILFSLRGQVAHDQNNSGNVGWSPCQLDYVLTRKSSYKIIGDDQLSHSQYIQDASWGNLALAEVTHPDVSEEKNLDG